MTSFYHTGLNRTQALAYVPLLALAVYGALVRCEGSKANAAVQTLVLRATLAVENAHRVEVHLVSP